MQTIKGGGKKDAEDPRNKDNEVLSTEEPRVNQEKDTNVNNTNNINTAYTYYCQLKVNVVRHKLTTAADVNALEESEGFEQIVYFLNANPIKYALTIHAMVDGKKVIISQATIRRDLKFKDEGGVDCLSNEVIFEQLPLIGSTIASAIICLVTNKKFNFSKYIFDSMVKHLDSGTKFLMYPSVPTEVVVDEAVYEEMYDSVERAAITATGLDPEQDKGIISKTQFMTTLNNQVPLGLVHVVDLGAKRP
nr:hypothetical protein [Tanacetum cinerariifolium]